MRKKKSGVRKFLGRLFHVKQRRVSKKQREKMRQEIIKDMIEKRKELIIDGQEYDAAVWKFEELMMLKTEMSGAGVSVTGIDAIHAIRCSKLPEFLLLLGVRIRG